jgi:TM2 domain-containing membrane protein YozV
VTKDLREYSKKTRTRLVFGSLALIFVVGDGLIYLLYGKEAGLFGLVCTLGALLPVLLIIALLEIADKVVKKNQ